MPKYDEKWMSAYFGDNWAADEALLALQTLDDQMRRRFGVPLYQSPGLTGLLSWERYASNRERFRPIATELQQLIRETTGQGRFECCPTVDPLPALHCLDMRLAYVASALSVYGGSEWRHDAGREFLGYTPARYKASWKVPPDWSHVGILPLCWKGGWEWPDSQERAGWVHYSWADASEVRLALANGWQVEILERLYCTDEKPVRPLENWTRKLLLMRGEIMAGSKFPHLYVFAVRNIILKTIGSLAQRPKVETKTVASRDDLPAHDLAEETYRETEGG